MNKIDRIQRIVHIILFFCLLLYIVFITYDSTSLNFRIRKLNAQVSTLKQQNDSLRFERNIMSDSISFLVDEMERMYDAEKLLIEENRIIEQEIIKNKLKYVKINKSVGNMSADSVRRYISNL
jgi:cell division protein FtsB